MGIGGSTGINYGFPRESLRAKRDSAIESNLRGLLMGLSAGAGMIVASGIDGVGNDPGKSFYYGLGLMFLSGVYSFIKQPMIHRDYNRALKVLEDSVD